MDENEYYLLNAGAEEVENLRSFLNSEVKTNQLLAINMMKAGGLPKLLVEDAFRLFLQNRSGYTKVFATGKVLLGIKSEIESLFKQFGYEMLVFPERNRFIFEQPEAAFKKLKEVGANANDFAKHFPVNFVLNGNRFSDAGLIASIKMQLLNLGEDLELSKSGIVKIPEIIDQFQYLKRVNLFDNEIERLPSTFSSLPRLQELVLSSNNMQSWDPAILKIKSLLVLDLSDNGMASLPENFENLQNLKWLFLGQNLISVLPKSLLYLESLQSIDLSNNHLNEIQPFIGELTNLETLNLKGNQIETIPDQIGNLKKLKTLNLNSNPIAHNKTEVFKLKKLLPEDCELII
jgi:hypothetical protein